MRDSPPAKLEFLPHVEGMRALAILLVVAAHAGVPYLAGGIVGVDVFFVISGYLITALLTIERSHSGRIDFLRFYARRLRRLLPALLLVLAATGLAALVLMPKSAHPETALAGASAALWLSNLYFAFADIGYFDAEAAGNPFLHTWSLGVEEQFYLIWPLLIAWTVRRWRIAFAVALAASLVAFLWLMATPHALQTHYLMPARIWQFALGALVWLWCHPQTTETRLPAAGALAGFGLILVAAVATGAHADHPEWRSLAASIGAALLLAAGGQRAEPNRFLRPLCAPTMLALGRVSYAWYLWHWPVLTLGQFYFVDASLEIRLLLVMFAWALATLTQGLVEAPIRGADRLLGRPGGFILASLATMLCAATVFYRWHTDARDWLAGQVEKNRYLAVRWDVPRIYADDCDDWYHSAELKICRFGAPEGKRTAVVMGDSIGLHWFPALEAVFPTPDWSLLVVTKSSCPMVDEPFHYARIKREFTECAEWRDKAVAAVAAMRPDILVLGTSFGYGFDERQWTEGTRRLLERLAPAVGRLYVMRATPTLPFDAIDCLAGRAEAGSRSAHDCAARWDDASNAMVWAWIGNAAAGFDNAVRIDMNEAVCPDGQCVAERNGMTLYRDKLHLTARFVASLADVLGERIAPPQGAP